MDRYEQYVDKVYEHWDKSWAFYAQPKLRKDRFRMKTFKQRELDREVNKLCTPREGDKKVILVMGNGAKGGFKGVKCIKGPCMKLYNHIVRRKMV